MLLVMMLLCLKLEVNEMRDDYPYQGHWAGVKHWEVLRQSTEVIINVKD